MVQKPYQGNDKYLFVSRVRTDEQMSNELISFLQGEGIHVWYDKEYEPAGDKPTQEWLDKDLAWEHRLVERLGNCAGIVVFLSKNSGHDSHVARQLKFALSHKKPVTVAQVDTVKPDATIELNLGLAECIQRSAYVDDAAFFQAVNETTAVKACLP